VPGTWGNYAAKTRLFDPLRDRHVSAADTILAVVRNAWEVTRKAGEEWPHTQNKPDLEFLVARLGVVAWDTLHLRKGKKYRIGP